MANITFRDEVIAAGELSILPRDVLKSATRKLRDRPGAGKPLTGNLKGYRSLHADGCRIVYRHHLDLDQVEIVAIGRRRDDEVYDMVRDRR